MRRRDDSGRLLDGVLTDVDGVARYTLRGEIDVANADQLQRRLRDACDAHGSRIEIDMAEVTFIDSSGLRALLLAHRHAEGLGGGVVVLRPSAAVVALVRLAGVEAALPAEEGTSWEDLQA